MPDQAEYSLRHVPNFAQLLPAILCKTNKDYDKQAALPCTRYRVDNVNLDQAKIQAFNRLTHWSHSGIVHPGFLHTLAFPLQLKLMLHKNFPFSIMGIVHIANSIQQYHAVQPSDRLELRCKLGEIRRLKIGYLFSLETEFFIKQQRVLLANHQYLRRNNLSTTKNKVGSEADWSAATDEQNWPLPNSLGWRYAKCSQDYNPIHLHPLSAKLLGFKQHIAHGMWMKSRAFSAVCQQPVARLQGPLRCDVEFKKPLFLPNSVIFQQRNSDQDTMLQFRIASQKGQQVIEHMTGRLQFLNGG